MKKRVGSAKTEKASGIGPDEASRIIKKFAAKQKVAIRLSTEQFEAIREQWHGMDPRRPAEITFYVGRRAASKMRIASCAYANDTCCV